ncbi:MAG: hypothetical protein Q9162_006201 [Coniocarpon cinnabarinum]
MSNFSATLKLASPSTQATLAEERSRSSIPVPELTQHLLCHDDFLNRQSRILALIRNEPIFQKDWQLHLSRPDRYKLGLARAKLLRRLGRKHAWSKADYDMAEYLVDEMSPYHLHMGMFATTVREQGSEDQKQHWIPLIERWEILGAYAQTEMGHGSNVRGLECQAVYDVAAREFVLHSPTVTASKWWNGSMGRTATHAIVVAQVFLPRAAQSAASAVDASRQTIYPANDDPTGPSSTSLSEDKDLVNLGPHPFVIQIRDQSTHLPLPGILVGDIGPKYGYASMDNGYMLFDRHRVPHSAFLTRYSHIDPASGRYTKPANAAVVYGSLTSIRAHIILHARLVLARAVTIAIRYTAMRRQFPSRDAVNQFPTSSSSSMSQRSSDGPQVELQVLDYPTVHSRLFPLLAQTFALHYTGLSICQLYSSSRSLIESTHDFSLLSSLHAQSSALKSQCTEYAANGIEICRRACGGHGFGGYSGFVGLNADYLSKVTVEGDNWMITAQAARWLVKRVGAVSEHLEKVGWDERRLNSGTEVDAWITKSIAQVLVLRRSGTRVKTIQPVLKSSTAIVRAFERRAAALAVDVWQARRGGKGEQDVQMRMHELSNAFAQALLVRNFHAALQTPQSSSAAPPVAARSVLHTLFRLYSLHTVYAHGLSFLSHTPPIVTARDVHAIPNLLSGLMIDVRPHAVKLVDSWAIPDFLLDSALGNEEGEVYERLWEWAHHRNPLNKTPMNVKFEDDEVVKGEGKYVPPWEEWSIDAKKAKAKL